MVLVDPFGRKATSLRIALTPRCNLKCIYCHKEGETSPKGEIKGETVVNVAMAAADLGFRSIKFTGGEPLMRADLEDIISQMPELNISLTTNGTYLSTRAHSLAEAGLDRVNVSMDSLNPQVYRSITGCRDADLDKVINGLDAAIDAGLGPIKLNVVLLKENEGEIWKLIDFARKKGLILQLIELLDINRSKLGGDVSKIERILLEKSDKIITREMHRRKKYFIDGAEVEVVRPMDNTEFCANCTRLRVTSDGKLKPCLLRNDNLIDISACDRASMRELIQIANRKRSPYFAKGQ
jgi:GTP 3',8-cyclase